MGLLTYSINTHVLYYRSGAKLKRYMCENLVKDDLKLNNVKIQTFSKI